MSLNNYNYEYKFENIHNSQKMTETKKQMSFDKLGDFKIDPKVTFDVTYENGSTFIDCEFLDLHSYGKNLEEAKKDMIVEIQLVWDHYIDGNQDRFGDEAKTFIKRFTEHVTRM